MRLRAVRLKLSFRLEPREVKAPATAFEQRNLRCSGALKKPARFPTRVKGEASVRRFFAPSPFTFPRVWPAGQLTGNASKSIGETRPAPSSFFRKKKKNSKRKFGLESLRRSDIFGFSSCFVVQLCPRLEENFSMVCLFRGINVFLSTTFGTMEIFLSGIRATISCELEWNGEWNRKFARWNSFDGISNIVYRRWWTTLFGPSWKYRWSRVFTGERGIT